MGGKSGYDEKYKKSGYYWGKEASSTCRIFLEQIKFDKNLKPTLIDIGCGEGRDVATFTESGFIVTGLECSLNGLEKTKILADEQKLKIKTIEADINNYVFDKKYDVIFSSGLLHYLTPEIKQKKFNQFKEHTNLSGYNVHLVFVDKPFIEKAPDAEENVYFFKSGELMTYYWDWEIIHFKELIFDCNSGGVDHRHAANRIIAKKVR